MYDNRDFIIFSDLKSLRKITLKEFNFIEFSDMVFDSSKIIELSMDKVIKLD